MPTAQDIKIIWDACHCGNPHIVLLNKDLIKIENMMRKSAANGQHTFDVSINAELADTLISMLKARNGGVVVGRVVEGIEISHSNKTRLKVSMKAFLK